MTSLGCVFRASAYSNLYFSCNNYTSSTPNALPSYSIHQSSNSVDLPDMFDARVMKMQYCHPPDVHKCVWQLGSTQSCWELKCSPDSLAAMGKGMGKSGERKGRGRV